MTKLVILSPSEQKRFDSPPKFNNAFTPRAEYILNNGKREITFGNQAHHYESQNKGQDVRKRSSSFGE